MNPKSLIWTKHSRHPCQNLGVQKRLNKLGVFPRWSENYRRYLKGILERTQRGLPKYCLSDSKIILEEKLTVILRKKKIKKLGSSKKWRSLLGILEKYFGNNLEDIFDDFLKKCLHYFWIQWRNNWSVSLIRNPWNFWRNIYKNL